MPDPTPAPLLLERLPDPDAPAPFWLSETGLYSDIVAKRLNDAAVELEPAFGLWSDGSMKRRWLLLPPGGLIDNRDDDHWAFPIGTAAFKEFRTPTRRLETRMIVRTGQGPDDYWMGAFLWDADESDARFVPEGADDVSGTMHDVPKVRNCWTCHRGSTSRLLGFSAVQLPGLDATLTVTTPSTYRPPGDSSSGPALGYLHGNCGHCHNPMGSARSRPSRWCSSDHHVALGHAVIATGFSLSSS